jgi:hypothetical protein
LYLPKTKTQAALPAVLFQSGHYWEGKAYPSYQRFCQGLARQGYVVLAFDPMGQGERIYYRNATGQSRLSSCDEEHTHPGKQMILVGDTCTRFQLWDAVRSLDFLVAQPMVDAKRIGVTGHSGGGTLSMLLAAIDTRVSAAAICMGNLENIIASPFNPPGSTDDAEQNLIGGGAIGLDRWDLLYPLAPKPLMVLPSDRDFYATYSPIYITNARHEFQTLSSVYRVLGKPECIHWADTPLPHALAYDSRMLIYNWLAKWLKPGSAPLTKEPDVKPQSVQPLWATPTGSTLDLPQSQTPFLLNRSRRPTRISRPLPELLQLPSAPERTPPKHIGSTRCSNVSVEAWEVTPVAGMRLPTWLIIQDEAPPDSPVVLSLDPQGAEILWFSPEVDHALPANSPIVCTADLRGIGSLAPQVGPGHPSYEIWHAHEENYAWASLVLAKPMLGQRVTDILSLVEFLKQNPRTTKRPIRLAASGALAVPALCAAALTPNIDRLYLNRPLVSFQAIVESENYSHTFANFVPGFLNHTDLPEILATLAPKKVILAGVVDAETNTMSIDAVQVAYSKAGSMEHVTIEPTADWTVDGIIRRSLQPGL